MSPASLTLVIAYLLFGFIISLLLRKGRANDWDEMLLASILGPVLFILIVVAVVGEFVWDARNLVSIRRLRS